MLFCRLLLVVGLAHLAQVSAAQEPMYPGLWSSRENAETAAMLCDILVEPSSMLVDIHIAGQSHETFRELELAASGDPVSYFTVTRMTGLISVMPSMLKDKELDAFKEEVYAVSFRHCMLNSSAYEAE